MDTCPSPMMTKPSSLPSDKPKSHVPAGPAACDRGAHDVHETGHEKGLCAGHQAQHKEASPHGCCWGGREGGEGRRFVSAFFA